MSRKQKRVLVRIIIAAALFAGGFFVPEAKEFQPLWWVRAGIFVAAYLTAGYDVLWKAIRNIARGRVFDENFLMTTASIGAMVIGEFSEGAAVMIFYQVGELFQSVAVGKSRRSISEMMDLSPEYANVEREGELVEVEPDEVAVGEVITIKPGEKVPLDGVVVFGASGLNTAALTGESALRDVAAGDEVYSGSVNTNGLLKIRVTKLYSDSTVTKILELVENSAENKAKSESFITRFARVYTPIVVGAAVLLAVLPPLFDGNWSGWVYRALTFLVVSCPCALVISVPLSYFGGVGAAARNGILVKGTNYLEALSKADTFVFDKTGTLTKGSFSVTEIEPRCGFSEEELLKLCAAAERISTHPIARSIVEAAEKNCEKSEGGKIPEAEDAEELAGFGVKARVGGKEILAGNARLMKKESIEGDFSREAAGTLVFCAADGAFAGTVFVSDEPKDGAEDALRALAGKKIMLTGDREAAAKKIAEELGLDEVRAGLLPDGKVAAVEEIFAKKSPKGALVFVGDGMNDAPSLARADVGVAMGALGSDAAIEAADVVLMNDRLENLPKAVKIAKKTGGIVTENIVFALSVKAAVLILSALGLANMWAAVFADVGVSVIAILNAMRTLRVK